MPGLSFLNCIQIRFRRIIYNTVYIYLFMYIYIYIYIYEAGIFYEIEILIILHCIKN